MFPPQEAFITNAGYSFAGCASCQQWKLLFQTNGFSEWWEAPEKSLTCLCFVEYSTLRGPIPICTMSPLYPTAPPLRALCESWAHEIHLPLTLLTLTLHPHSEIGVTWLHSFPRYTTINSSQSACVFESDSPHPLNKASFCKHVYYCLQIC